MSRGYMTFAGAVLLGFAILEILGTNLLPTSAHATAPASVRSSPGGYRSYHFWRTGYRGGK